MDYSKIQRDKFSSIEDNVGMIRSKEFFSLYSMSKLSASFDAVTQPDNLQHALDLGVLKLSHSVGGIVAYFEYVGEDANDVLVPQLEDARSSDNEDRNPDQLYLRSFKALSDVQRGFYMERMGEDVNVEPLIATYIRTVEELTEQTDMEFLNDRMEKIEKW